MPDEIHEVFQEEVLNAGDVCSNCFRLVRVERPEDERESSDPRSATSVQRSRYQRQDRNTVIAHGPAERASASIGTFCECGCESAYHRIRRDDACPVRDRFHDLAANALRALEAKGIHPSRREFSLGAWGEYLSSGDVDAAISAGIRRGLARASSSSPSAGAEPMVVAD